MAFAEETIAPLEQRRYREATTDGLRPAMLVIPALISAIIWLGLIDVVLKLLSL